MAEDLATLAFAVNSAGVEAGSRRGVSALDALEKKALSLINTVDRLQQRLNQSLGLSGLRSGPGARQSAIEEVEARHQARMAEITGRGVQQRLNIEARAQSQLQSIHARRESATERHAQRLTEIEARGASRGGLSVGLSRAATAAALSLATGLTALGHAAVQSAIDIDAQINVLKSLTGSAEAAERRYAQLIATAQKTPGLTTRLAATLNAQLRVAGATEQAINRVLPAIGKLNAITNLRDPQRFAQNLVQLATQNFERTDLKELVGQSPLAGELIKQIFKVDSPTNAKAIRESAQKLGITTVDAFAEAFGKAAEANQKFANVTESIGTQIEKLRDRITVALRPLGLAILSTTGPLIERAAPIIEKLSAAFANLPAGGKTAIVVLGGLAAVLAPLLLLFGKAALALLAVAAAVANLALIWKTNFFGMRDIATDAFEFVVAASRRVNGEFKKNQDSLRELTTEFRRFSDEATPIVRAFWETFKLQAQVSLEATLVLVKAFVAQTKVALAALTAQIEAVKLASRLADKGLEIGPGLTQPGGLATLLARTRGERAIREAEAQKRAQQKAGGRDGEEVTVGMLADFNAADARRRKEEEEQRKLRNALKGADDKKKGEGEARALRAAQETLAKAQAEAQFDIQQKLIRNLIELDRDAYERRELSADAFYARVTEQEMKLNDLAKDRVRAELAAAQVRDSQAKPRSAEALREQAQIVGLNAQLEVLELDRTDTLRKINEELAKGRKLEKERLKDALEAAQKSIAAGLAKAGAEFSARRESQLNAPQTELAIKEAEIQGLRLRGLITEQQATDALILTQRRYRDALIASAEARRLTAQDSDDPGRFAEIARLDEQIAGLRNLGVELTRAEALQKRFAEQTVLDLSRVNEGVEDFLASQKTITETFADFRTNQVADVFGLIERGVDKLTEKLGVLGSALNQFLKDLLKLAATEVFKKLFNLTASAQQPAFSVAGGGAAATLQQALGSFRITNPFNMGGGQGGSFAIPGAPNTGAVTPPFAGGSIPGLPGGGGFQIPGIGGQGGFNLGGIGGLLRRIPGLGRLFGPNVGSFDKFLTVNPGGGLPEIPVGQAASSAINFGALGASGLLLGGGLLGGLLGGKSQIGRLLGGVGGTLLAGAAGGAGLFGGGIAAALPALFSNPITAIIGGALIGGALLARLFGDKLLKSLRGLIKGEYAIDVKSNKTLEQIKAIGEGKFGREFKRKQIETVRLPETRELLFEYAQRTGQRGNSKLFSAGALQDPFNEANRFVVRREFGGPLAAYQAALVGERRPEVIVPMQPSYVFPSIRAFEQSRPAPLAPPRRQPANRGEAPQSADNAQLISLMRMVLGAVVNMTEAANRLKGIPPGEIVQQGLASNPTPAAIAVNTEFARRSAISSEIRDNVNRR